MTSPIAAVARPRRLIKPGAAPLDAAESYAPDSYAPGSGTDQLSFLALYW
jgi:hypothetical protein